MKPPGFLGHPEDARRPILVWVFRISALLALGFEFRVLGFEGVGDVLQEDETKDDVLVLCRVHVVAERIRHAPELRFIHTDYAGVAHVTYLEF